MARIRTIKPDFSSDGKTKRLTDSTALFFILLWNHCDDYGYFNLDTLELALKTSRWRAQEVFKFCSALVGAGLVRCSSGVGVGQVMRWEHQRINDRRASKWNDANIEWDNVLPNARGSEKNLSVLDSIGEERRGKDTRKPKKTKTTAEPSASAPAISESQKAGFLISKYCEAWKAKHGSSPPITGKDAGIAKRLAKGFSDERVESLLAAFFEMPDAYLFKAKHPLELFEMKLKEVAAFADSGSFVTRRQVVQFDDMASNAILLDQVRKGQV